MNRVPVNLAGTVLGHTRHICAFFNSKDEEYRVLVPFLKEGLERGERAFHLVDKRQRDAHLKRLKDNGVDVETAEETGQLRVCPWEDGYLQEGHFDTDRMIATVESVLNEGKVRGFLQTRLWANMEWALEDLPGVTELVEYETRLNHVLPNYDDPVCCAYDISKFDAATIMDILRTHPMVLIGGVLHENPYFVPPDQMLAELQARRAS